MTVTAWSFTTSATTQRRRRNEVVSFSPFDRPCVFCGSACSDNVLLFTSRWYMLGSRSVPVLCHDSKPQTDRIRPCFLHLSYRRFDYHKSAFFTQGRNTAVFRKRQSLHKGSPFLWLDRRLIPHRCDNVVQSPWKGAYKRKASIHFRTKNA